MQDNVFWIVAIQPNPRHRGECAFKTPLRLEADLPQHTPRSFRIFFGNLDTRSQRCGVEDFCDSTPTSYDSSQRQPTPILTNPPTPPPLRLRSIFGLLKGTTSQKNNIRTTISSITFLVWLYSSESNNDRTPFYWCGTRTFSRLCLPAAIKSRSRRRQADIAGALPLETMAAFWLGHFTIPKLGFLPQH